MNKKLILVTSPPACGKTYVAKALAKQLHNIVYLDKDTLIVLSKQIFKVAGQPYDRSSAFFEKNIRDYEYDCILALALEALDYNDLVLVNAPFTKEVRNEILESLAPGYINGLSLLGGEPFEPENQRELLPFVRNFKALYPNKTVWCYSGYTWEQLTGSVPCPARCEVTDELLSLLDVLVDGRFVEAQHDISLRFRGSSNQRLLDVPKSLAAKSPVWWEDEQVFATHSM